MPTAVVRIRVGEVDRELWSAGLAQLREIGLDVLPPPDDGRTPDEIAFLEEDLGTDRTAGDYQEWCRAVFDRPVEIGIVTYVSRGTDDDALAVLDRFGVQGQVLREHNGEDEIVLVTLHRHDGRRVPESRLHTALEAALNAEVRIRTA
ncbi:hypothetical protein GIS00_14610 [Nakamurella sp. YIM 132087]|uniref:Uncharacterized protein n=1 Tax=Nakamurella alba TaxID=2665158 RepID=A0A7K1FLZ2_9ACTN|nr:hypothetical protein [Nakamurella alba]MTD15172.1 hypothetical protein [Nakamurella alba]